MVDLLEMTDLGLYCGLGDFYVDPRTPVDRAVVTHAHTDHARWGCRRYLAAASSEHLLRMRLNPDAEFTFLKHGQSLSIGGVRVSFHPAGHILGSSQVRLEHRGRVAVVSGDYKLGNDPTCEAWQPVKCDLFVTESTFGLPVYRWREQREVIDPFEPLLAHEASYLAASARIESLRRTSIRGLPWLPEEFGHLFENKSVTCDNRKKSRR